MRQGRQSASLYNMLRENIQDIYKPRPAIRPFLVVVVSSISQDVEVILGECDNTLLRAKKFIFKENRSCYEVKILFSAIITSFISR